MAAGAKKKKIAIRFELSWGGLLAIGVVCFCIFLWMFLLGVWTGQTLLGPSGTNSAGLTDLASKYWQQGEEIREKIGKSSQNEGEEAEKISVINNDKEKEVPTVFSIQVAAFRKSEKARQQVVRLRARDYESFYLAPEQPNGNFYRVFVGAFNTMADAKKIKAKLEVSENNKYFINLIPASEKRFP